MTHNEIAARYRQILATVLNTTEDQIPNIPWDSIIYYFARINAHHPPLAVDKKILNHIAFYL